MRPTPLLALCLVLAGCGERAPAEGRLMLLRSYGWPADVVEPAPDWNPAKPTLVASSLGGFSLLEEGGRGEQRFAAEDRKETFFPRWLNGTQFVFGPGRNATQTASGTVVHPSDGLTVVPLGEGKPLRRTLADRGYQPQPGAEGLVWAQALDQIFSVDSRGAISEFGGGFDPQPQPDGPGLCWHDTPVFTTDWWTGSSGLGSMQVRWQPGQTDVVGGAVQAAWTNRGGVILTVLDAAAPAGSPWWAGGTHLVHLPGPGATPQSLRRAARDPQPHPIADLLAWTAEDGGIWIGTIRADGWSERLAPAGRRPRWSPDGLRLCWLADPVAPRQTPDIRVAVLGPAR